MKEKSSAFAMCLAIAMLLTAGGCGDNSATDSTESASDSASADTVEETADDTSQEKAGAVEVDADAIQPTTDADDNQFSYATYDAAIKLEGTTATITGDQAANVIISGSNVTITSGGTYYVSGELSDGTLSVTGDEKVKLYFDGVSIAGSDAPALLCTSEKRTILTLAEGSENQLIGGENTDENCAVSVDDDITINGAGTLSITQTDGVGIHGKDDVKIVGCTINIDAGTNAIRGSDSIFGQNCTLNLTAGNDGMKSTNSDNPEKGYVQLESCNVTIDAGGDSVQAETLVRISGGTYSFESRGDSKSEDDETSSAKGIKCSGNVEILDGDMTIVAPEDGINCNGTFLLSGGTVSIESGMDGIQSDGDLTQSGGTLNITTTGEIVKTVSNFGGPGGGGGFGGGGGGNFGGGNFGGGGGNQPQQDDFSGGFRAKYSSNFVVLAETGDDTSDAVGSSKGLKAGGDLFLSGGDCTIVSTDHAVHAEGTGTISGTTLTISSENKGISVHGDLAITDGDIVIETATEGIESKANISISGGSVRVLYASDDGINTGGTGGQDTRSEGHDLSISGGYVFVCGDCDGIDSNAALDISGGTVVVYGPVTGMDGSLDFGTSMTYTGGTLLSLSKNGMMEYADEGLLVTTAASASAGDTITVVDSDGNVVISVITPKQVSDIIFGLQGGDTDDYTIYVGGTYSGSYNDDNIGFGGTLSGGEEVTISASGGGFGFGGGGFGRR